jgi:hypothetical protein
VVSGMCRRRLLPSYSAACLPIVCFVERRRKEKRLFVVAGPAGRDAVARGAVAAEAARQRGGRCLRRPF